MGTLYLVRHGQASFGAADYDQRSALRHKQAVRLDHYWRDKSMQFDAVPTGTLRPTQTFNRIAEGTLQACTASDAAGTAANPLPALLQLPRLNEYDSQALLRDIHTGPLPVPDPPERYPQYFRLLSNALKQWMAGVISPQGMCSWEDFADEVHAAQEQVRRNDADKKTRTCCWALTVTPLPPPWAK